MRTCGTSLSPGVRRVSEFLGYVPTFQEEEKVAGLLTCPQEGPQQYARFFRQGRTGDWRNHFTEEHVRLFKEMGGDDILIEQKYETTKAWGL